MLEVQDVYTFWKANNSAADRRRAWLLLLARSKANKKNKRVLGNWSEQFGYGGHTNFLGVIFLGKKYNFMHLKGI